MISNGGSDDLAKFSDSTTNSRTISIGFIKQGSWQSLEQELSLPMNTGHFLLVMGQAGGCKMNKAINLVSQL